LSSDTYTRRHAPTPIQTGIVYPLLPTTKLAGVLVPMAWSGEAIDLIEGKLKVLWISFGFETLRVKFKPTDVTLKLCEEAGTDFAQTLKKARSKAPRQPATNVEQAVGRMLTLFASSPLIKKMSPVRC